MPEPTVLKMPAAKEIDAKILKYSNLKAAADRAAKLKKLRDGRLDVAKDELIALVEACGSKHAAKSKRLAGNHNTATTTIGSTTVVVDDAVDKLRAYVDGSKVDGLPERFFTRHVTYQLVSSPDDVLKTVDVPGRMRTRLQTLIALCFKQKPKAASLAVDVVKAA